MAELERETPSDWWEVEALFDLCFVPGRTALSSYRLRDDVPPVADLCNLLRDGSGAVAAAIRFWPVRVGEASALLLGPIAVHPTHQGEGLAAYLIQQSTDQAVDLGWDRVLLVGDLAYYQRLGFQKLEGVEMPPPTNPDRILGLGLAPGAWDGVAGPVTKWVTP